MSSEDIILLVIFLASAFSLSIIKAYIYGYEKGVEDGIDRYSRKLKKEFGLEGSE
jgi:hypothetical protein